MSKEKAFNEKISPLLEEIHRICDEHSIAFVNSFFVGNDRAELCCSTGWNLKQATKANEHFRQCAVNFLVSVGVSKEELFVGGLSDKDGA